MSKADNKCSEGTPVDPSTVAGTELPTSMVLNRANSEQVTTPVSVNELTNTLTKAFLEDQRWDSQPIMLGLLGGLGEPNMCSSLSTHLDCKCMDE